MSLPNPGMSFTPFDTLPAADLNDIVENVEALATGTGLDDSAVAPTKLSLFRIQTDNSNVIANTIPVGVRIQAGWGQVVGAGTANAADTVTFPNAFTTLLYVAANPIGAKVGSAATSITNLSTVHGAPVSVEIEDQSNTGFTVAYRLASGTLGASDYHAYSWIAIGV